MNDPEFTVFGVTVRTRAGTEFEDIDDSPLAADQFFHRAVGRLVDVEGTLDGTIIDAEEVSLED